MCKVYEFPRMLELPQDEKEVLSLLGEAYILALYNSLFKLVGNEPTRENMEEVTDLVNQAFTEGMRRAIEKKEKGF